MGATYRLLLDENIEHEVFERLVDVGHDVEQVDTVAVLGRDSNDTDLAAYSRDIERATVTYDDDLSRTWRRPSITPYSSSRT